MTAYREPVLSRLVLKNLVQRPLRYVLTSFAIVFSVAAVSAVFIFTGGLRSTFDQLAQNIESGYDIAVQPTSIFGNDGANLVPVDHLDIIDSVPGVLAAQPRIVDVPVIPVDGDDELIFAPAGPNLGVLWGERSPNTSLFLQTGERPEGTEQFALDIDTFDAGNFVVGETYTIDFSSDVAIGRTFELTGTFTFANPDRNALVGAAIVAFDEPTALELLTAGEGFSDIVVVLEADADQLATIDALVEVVNDDLQVRTQAEVLEETQGNFGEILTIFQTVLSVFAFIIAGVSGFLIYNVFSITLGQRIQELGLLRAVGAFGSQVTNMMIGEAVLLGVISTAIGIPGGLGLAFLLREALVALGFPDNTGLPITAGAIIAALVVGIGITVGSATIPALQAKRVPPIAALRDSPENEDFVTRIPPALGIPAALGLIALFALLFTVDGWIPSLIIALGIGILSWVAAKFVSPIAPRFMVIIVGIAVLLIGAFIDAELSKTFATIGGGAMVTIAGAIMAGPLVAKPMTNLLGRTPSIIVCGLLGLVFAIASVGALVGAIGIAATGVPNSIIDATGEDIPAVGIIAPLIAGTVIFGVIGYGMIRTAWGGLGLALQLARANAARNPQRTSTTAAAMMIGLTLVTTVTVVGDSIKASVSDAFDTSITSDFTITGPQSQPGGAPFAATARERVLALDEVETVVPFRFAFPAAWATSASGELRAEDFIEFLPIILQLLDDGADLSPEELLAFQQELGTDVELNSAGATDFDTLELVVDPGFIERDPELAELDNAIYLFEEVAEDGGLEVGDTFSALFADLESEDLVVAGIYDNGFVLGDRVVKIDFWEQHLPATDNLLSVVTASGVSEDAARAAIEAELEVDFPALEPQTTEEFAAQAQLQLNQLLATVNVLLGLSALIAALGILVALSLAVFERTREIGLFRAVGSTRAQTRWIIRWEGVIIAAFGGFLGIILGVLIGVLAANNLPDVVANRVSVPVTTLAIYLISAGLTGLAAAVFPAWIAGRMNILDAISADG